MPLKPPPPNFRNHGNYVTSIAKLGRFLGEKAEEAGVYLLTETAADKLLVSDRIVKGVRSGDKGRDRDGEPLPNFEPGSDVVARATVLAEGTQGHLTGAAMDYFGLHGLQPQRWELGVKEIWKVPKPLDRVIHTMGWPLRKGAKYNEFGGSFIYPMGEDKVSIGLVVGLDYTDATFSVHDALQELKTHPFVRKILEGGEREAWGAKTIPSGGYWALPRKMAVPGMVMCGDNAGMCNVSELKGIHYAMHAGMYAAEAIVAALKRDEVNFDAYDARVRNSAIAEDLYRWRNVRQSFSKGFFVGGAIANMALLSGGLLPPGRWKQHEDSEEEMDLGKAADGYPKPDNKYTFDKLSSVFASGNATRDDAPNHIRVQRHVPREVAQTWVSMCPAQVYEIPEEQLANGAAAVDLEHHAVELRPVRRDHRQGRAADSAPRAATARCTRRPRRSPALAARAAARRLRGLRDERRDHSARRCGWSSEHERLGVGDRLDPCVGDRLREALRVGELEEAVLGSPGEQGRSVELAKALRGLQRVALVQPGGELGRVAPHPGVSLRGLHPAVDQLGGDLGLRERRERRAANRAQAERQRHHGHRARQLRQGRHQLEGRGREVLVRVAVGEHQPADSLRAPRREHLRDRPAAVVARRSSRRPAPFASRKSAIRFAIPGGERSASAFIATR